MLGLSSKWALHLRANHLVRDFAHAHGRVVPLAEIPLALLLLSPGKVSSSVGGAHISEWNAWELPLAVSPAPDRVCNTMGAAVHE